MPIENAVRKIKVAAAARSSKDFQIIARTDARTAHGLDEALRRAEAFVKAGADILFVESPESVEEMQKIGQTFDVPLLANMVESGRTPVLTRQQLEKIGYRIAIFPIYGLLAMSAALRLVYGKILAKGSTANGPGEMDTLDRMARLMGFERIWAFDKENAEI